MLDTERRYETPLESEVMGHRKELPYKPEYEAPPASLIRTSV
jgi:hypothetical protein